MNNNIKLLIESFFDTEEEIEADIKLLPNGVTIADNAKPGDLIKYYNTLYVVDNNNILHDLEYIAVCVASKEETHDMRARFMSTIPFSKKGYYFSTSKGTLSSFMTKLNIPKYTALATFVNDGQKEDSIKKVLKDINGYEYTNKINSVKQKCPAAKFCKELENSTGHKYYLPTLGEFNYYYKNKDIIDKVFHLHGDQYWTSSIYSSEKSKYARVNGCDYYLTYIFRNESQYGPYGKSWWSYSSKVLPFIYI